MEENKQPESTNPEEKKNRNEYNRSVGTKENNRHQNGCWNSCR
jgi:hypothetical protein